MERLSCEGGSWYVLDLPVDLLGQQAVAYSWSPPAASALGSESSLFVNEEGFCVLVCDVDVAQTCGILCTLLLNEWRGKMSQEVKMISVDEALEYVMKHFEPLEPEEVEILDTLDRVLAEDVYSDTDIPPFDNSAMDGYAVRAADTVGASHKAPITLRVIANLAAGYTTVLVVEAGTAIRIMTGAPLPAGADAVVRFEETSEGLPADERTDRRILDWEQGAWIEVFKQVIVGENVRRAGEDIHKGELVLAEGTILRPQEIGVLASLGRARVRVIRRPRVAILATGDELIGVDEPLAPGKIRNSNEYSNAALVQRYGGIPVRLGIARDDVEELTAKIREGLAERVDLFLTSAGVSVGDYDVVKDVLGAEGEMHFWQVRMKPGKPLAFGEIQGVPLLGLPGNPVSAMVSFEQFARPAILKMLGKTRLRKPTVEAILEEDVESSGRRSFKRAVITKRDGEYYASVTGPQGSGVLTSMVKANGLAVIPEGIRHLKAGERVTVQMLDWPENVACTDPVEVDEAPLVIPIISVVGKSEVGKTTLLEKLVAELKQRGYRVAAVKHDIHGFEIDRPGKDSWRLAQAGSDSIVIASPKRLALIKRLDREMALSEIAALLTDVDIILTEGYKRGDAPKIEVSRREKGGELLCTPDELVALVSDQLFDLDVPQFGLDDTTRIVDWLEGKFLSGGGQALAG